MFCEIEFLIYLSRWGPVGQDLPECLCLLDQQDMLDIAAHPYVQHNEAHHNGGYCI